ncbi:SIR2-like protein [Chitinophaga niastensis]|uniref:SIR2-like protein n=1 Tax=Chitinophaga niastensis TaxID=536980 RepID=A0A2P8HGT7_CHINA|nr:SIR2 family protein [Chitinophaga niastensis]PSL45400.1 SIR2-like protein [Chitinophaga niastensis]
MILENNSDYDILLNSIRAGDCALILGPLFAVTADGSKVNELLRSELQHVHNVDLDTDFDNIFIARSYPPGMQPIRLENIIAKFYPAIQSKAHHVYSQIAHINFNTIVSFTQDEFLSAAFREAKINHSFQYFYARGTSKRPDEQGMSGGDSRFSNMQIPTLYNLYGRHSQSDSLIISYDAFYEFLFSFIGEQQAQLNDMKMRLTASKVFLFLGFDLKKWYVPIMLTKLLKSGTLNGRRVLAIATLDDTAERENKNYMEWLTRYPLEMTFIDMKAIDLMAAITQNGAAEEKSAAAAGDDNPVRGKCIFRQQLKGSAPAISFDKALAKVSQDSDEDALITTSDGLCSFINEGNGNSRDIITLNSIKGKLNTLKGEKGNITEEMHRIRMEELRTAIIDLAYDAKI